MQIKLNEYIDDPMFIVVDSEMRKSGALCVCGEKKEYVITDSDYIGRLNDGDLLYINNWGLVSRVYEYASASIDIMTTTHCNSNCIMCPLSEGARQSNELGHIEWLNKLIEYLPNNIEHICITGGEPTLIRSNLFDLIEKLKIKYNNANFQLLTNGRSCGNYGLSKKLHDTLPNNTLIGIPLHAGNKKLYDDIAQVEGGFEQVVQGIKNMVALGSKIEIRVVVSALNADYLLELAKFIVSELKGIYCVTFMGVETMGNAVKHLNDVWISYYEATKACENAIEYLINNGIDCMLYNYPLCMINDKYWTLSRRSITPYKVKYYEECNQCSVKEACSGFFQSTFKVVNQNVRPVRI